VANFIVRGRWVSHQMDDSGHLMKFFSDKLLDDKKRIVNSFPSNIRPHIFSGSSQNKVYSFIDNHFKANQFSYYLDNNEDTYNILVIGPTGTGKSHLINVMFNERICESKVSHHSVTREIYFIRGKGQIFDVKSSQYVEKNIVVADTIGLCDTEWGDSQIIDMIKGRVSSNIKYLDRILIVFKADRLTQHHIENIKRIMEWLKYKDNNLAISFIATYAEHIETEKKDQLREEAERIFNVKSQVFSRAHNKTFQSLIYTGFPPEKALNDLIRLRVEESWEELRMIMTLPAVNGRVEIQPCNYSCNIL
jgi:ribosome biogenesis GTPase A